MIRVVPTEQHGQCWAQERKSGRYFARYPDTIMPFDLPTSSAGIRAGAAARRGFECFGTTKHWQLWSYPRMRLVPGTGQSLQLKRVTQFQGSRLKTYIARSRWMPSV